MTIALRSYPGPAADEVAILCRPAAGAGNAAGQAEAAYRGLAETLADQNSSFGDLVSETLFVRDIARELPAILAVRGRILDEFGQTAAAPRPGFIEQAPVDGALELAAAAVIPRSRDASSVRDIEPDIACGCEGCSRSGARRTQLGDQITIQTANLYGAGADAYEQSREMFHVAERLLQKCGMGFQHVVRTWIQLRDIDRDYDALNRARREFFQRSGVQLRPASTGVQGGPFPDEHVCSLSLQAVSSPAPPHVAGMSTRSLNEAWSYGADFSRGLRVVEANKIALHVSGTASIDDAGRTVHPGDFEAQAERMLVNIEGLLAGQGATVGDILSAVTYVKRREDGVPLRAILRRRGFDGFPCALVEAPLCRPELLCETEALAVLAPDAPRT